MVLRRRRSVRRTPVRRRRAPLRRAIRRKAGKNWKRILRGALLGTAASVGGFYVGQNLGRPILAELGQRGASVAAAKYGGWEGVALFQVIDAAFDRGIVASNLGVNLQSGTIVRGI